MHRFSIVFLVACSGGDPELAADQQASSDPHSAINVSYANTTSGLPAANVQEALDVLTARPSVGPQGPQGEQGPIGPVGAVGPQGLSGADGRSVTSSVLLPGDAVCFEGGARFDTVSGTSYACNGSQGVVGPVGGIGPMGPQGPQGPDGPQGAIGPTGALGPAGPKGDTGPAGPSGASSVQLAPDGWEALSPDGKFFGRMGGDVWRSEATAFDAPVLLAVTLPPAGPHGTGTVTNGPLFVGFTTDDEIAPALFVMGSVVISGVPRPTIDELRLDRDHVGELVAHHPFDASRVSMAPAGTDASGAEGGFVHDRRTFFAIVHGTHTTTKSVITTTPADALSTFDISDPGLREHVVIPDLRDFVSGGRYPNGTCGDTFSGLVHDPASKRILIGDPCTHAIWVIGYQLVPHQAATLSLVGAIRPPQIGALGYDAARHILWSGSYGITLDLATM